MQTCNPSVREVAAGGSEVQVQSQLHNESEATLGSMRPCQKNPFSYTPELRMGIKGSHALYARELLYIHSKRHMPLIRKRNTLAYSVAKRLPSVYVLCGSVWSH